ncbi:nucleotidyltransferase substrate binding protein [Arenibaculum sp.]|jgi:nucleotidyltransferase substrate binding protein (TIGR01987 family)|uniref:nucleotidyltransferase substrate binding protein n=1 Tax=Arenibaculum sp. TaxID=2865862 RepID=UPI002E127D1A|nr:nucleotidyltransferase substrate binding protein [Arenibaculum sp.]
MGPGTGDKPRWLYRLDNFGRAIVLLREAVEILRSREMSQLEKEGMVQRFEFTWELAWKLLKDYLEHSGIVLQTVTPAAVIRAAFAAKLIEDGEVWMQALDARNRMAHTYNGAAFDAVAVAIRDRYFAALEALHRDMAGRAATGEAGRG